MGNQKKKARKRRATIVFIVLLLLTVWAVYMWWDYRQANRLLYLRIISYEKTSPVEKASFYVMVADDRDERRRGLMFRKHLPENQGMLFVFPDERNREFYMRDTFIPLDIIFADRSKKIVGIVHNATPLTEVRRKVDSPSQYVLEINGGLSKKYRIKTGDVLEFNLRK